MGLGFGVLFVWLFYFQEHSQCSQNMNKSDIPGTNSMIIQIDSHSVNFQHALNHFDKACITDGLEQKKIRKLLQMTCENFRLGSFSWGEFLLWWNMGCDKSVRRFFWLLSSLLIFILTSNIPQILCHSRLCRPCRFGEFTFHRHFCISWN